MMLKEIVTVIFVLAILEGLFAFIAPKQVKALVKYFAKKSEKYYRKIGLIELIVSVIILIFTYYYL